MRTFVLLSCVIATVTLGGQEAVPRARTTNSAEVVSKAAYEARRAKVFDRHDVNRDGRLGTTENAAIREELKAKRSPIVLTNTIGSKPRPLPPARNAPVIR